MSPYLAELIGTAFLIVLGDGVVASVILNKSKGNQGGWIVITLGWGMAVFIGVYATAKYSGAHLNPAVTFSQALQGKFPWEEVPAYVAAQLAGAMLGAFLVWLTYKKHFDETPDADTKLGVFCTIPAIRNPKYNFLTEFIATMVFILAISYITGPTAGIGSLDALPVAFVVLAIGLSLGGPTGYAINPARDLGPRLMHFLLPIPGKRNSDWSYAWIPVLGPLAGAAAAAFLYQYWLH
ncbi:glycerol uptake facilitator protein [Chitinophaga ginsengisegetis]|uniref:Glycerol uptake facilitator protein n=1 Tax=Chitinophaga ginsengisegetis TaxID=393003 RepID=A0A1T5P2C1_9BACT|nr:MIP/aquaporin family protein [Chitinophaga ginsengisegetis]MDR6566828.1 glycerol uptake facilitator protein [Chitinophaga ginsengisegetis]MDR6646558.1 glycerol uptake facilitator protein [Chitinophaga ginsengisegetis]MDR6652908.1 glycerol uptake facilitator protein [Chitinophaga ginsengisegetis]SKD06469.1 glycerol uptake facilitator protein [Chitinophaga ginsengisegetis]